MFCTTVVLLVALLIAFALLVVQVRNDDLFVDQLEVIICRGKVGGCYTVVKRLWKRYKSPCSPTWQSLVKPIMFHEHVILPLGFVF